MHSQNEPTSDAPDDEVSGDQDLTDGAGAAGEHQPVDPHPPAVDLNEVTEPNITDPQPPVVPLAGISPMWSSFVPPSALYLTDAMQPTWAARQAIANSMWSTLAAQQIIANSRQPTLTAQQIIANSMWSTSTAQRTLNSFVPSPLMKLITDSMASTLQLQKLAVEFAAPWSIATKSLLPDNFHVRFLDILRQARDRIETDDAELLDERLYLEAVQAREVVLNKLDPEPALRRFARTWLGIRDIDEHVVEAIAQVLLEDDWYQASIPDGQLRHHLVNRIRKCHETTRPIFERQLNHHREIYPLSTPAASDIGPVTLADLIRHPGSVEDEILDPLGWRDERLIWLQTLDPDKRAVLEQYAHQRITWGEAGIAAGYDPKRGKAARQRAQYLATDYRCRQQMRRDR
jgi:hypothetical protein